MGRRKIDILIYLNMKNKLWSILSAGLFGIYLFLIINLGFDDKKTTIVGIIFFISVVVLNFKKITTKNKI
jgi:hypothetical protein